MSVKRFATQRGSQNKTSHSVFVQLQLHAALHPQCQICCNDGNIHQMNHVLMLSPVEVLAYIQ